MCFILTELFVHFDLIYFQASKKTSSHIWSFSNVSELKLRNRPANKQNWDLYYRDNVKAVMNEWIVSSLQIKVTQYIWPCACQDGIPAAALEVQLPNSTHS